MNDARCTPRRQPKAESAALYPIFLDMRGEAALVAGGGAVAERKIRRLLECGARVTLVSPSLTERLRQLEADGKLRWLPRTFEPSDLDGFRMAFALTDSRTANEAIVQQARHRGVWVNSAHALDGVSFHTPGAVQRGPLTIAVSTGGRTPSLSKCLREQLERSYGPEYAELTVLLGEARGEADAVPLERLRAGDLEGALSALRAWKAHRKERSSA